jgi:hypothetical protein
VSETTAISTIGLRAFDAGVVLAFGAELVGYAVDGVTRQAYAVTVDGMPVANGIEALGGRVPVRWTTPDDPYQHHVLPSYIIKRNDMRPAYDRAAYFGVQRAPALGALPVVLPTGERGYTQYETRRKPHPFDFSYDVQGFARHRSDTNAMLVHVLRRCKPPWFGLTVVDSHGDERRYDTGDFNISDVSELSDIAKRSVGFTLSWTVRGEIDLTEPEAVYAMTQVELAMYNYHPI